MDWELVNEIKRRLYAWTPGEPLLVRGVQLPSKHMVRTPLGTYLAYHVQSVMFLEALGVPRQMMLQFFSNGGDVVYHYSFPIRERAASLYLTPSLFEAADVIRQEKLGDVATQKFKRHNPFEHPPFWMSGYSVWRYGPLREITPETVVAAFETVKTGMSKYPPLSHITRGFAELSGMWQYVYKSTLRGAHYITLARYFQIAHYGTAEWVAIDVNDLRAAAELNFASGKAPFEVVGSMAFHYPEFLQITKGYELL